MNINGEHIRKGTQYVGENRQKQIIKSIQIGRLDNIENLIRQPEVVDEIDLEGNYFKVIEPKLSLFTTLRILNLEQNLISNIENLDDFPYLEKLNLGSNRITRIGKLDAQTALNTLDLSNNYIKKIESLNLPQQRNLNQSNNKILYLQNMDKLVSLETFEAAKNEISEVDYLLIVRLGNLRHLDFSYNKIPLNNLDPLVNILKEQYTVKSVDFMGNEVALNKFYKVKIAEINHIEKIDQLPIKDYARKDWQNIKNAEEFNGQIKATKKEYGERAKEEYISKTKIVQMINKQAQNVEKMYDDYRQELDDDMLQFQKWAYDFENDQKQGKIVGQNSNNMLKVWKEQLISKEKERDNQYLENQQKHETIKNDYLDRKINATKFTKKLYQISYNKPEQWKELKRAEYAIVKGEAIPILEENKQKSMLEELDNEAEEEIADMGEQIKHQRAHELVKNVLGPDTQLLQDQKERAVNVISKVMRNALGKEPDFEQPDAIDIANQDSLIDLDKLLMMKNNSKKSLYDQRSNILKQDDISENVLKSRISRNKEDYYSRDETIHWYEEGNMQSYKPDNRQSSSKLKNNAMNILSNNNENYFNNYVLEKDYIKGL